MKRHRLSIIALIVVVTGIVTLLVTVKPVPSHQGKTVSDWMMETRSSALESNPGLMAIGSNAVPYLAEALATEPTKYDRYAWVRSPTFQKMAGRLHLDYTWTKPAEEVQRWAAWSLLAFGFEAKPALSQIHAHLLRPRNQNRQMMIHCLGEMRCPPESIPWLVKAYPLTTNESDNVRHDLLHLLGQGGTNAAKLAMPLVIEALNDRKVDVGSMAAQTLARWGQPAPQAIPSLLLLLNGTNDQASMSAASALGRITNRCDEALPGVRRLLDSTNDYTRAIAAMTLWRLGGDAEETRRTLEGLLTSQRAKGVAASFLGQMGESARASVPALLKASQESAGRWVEMYDRAQCAKAVLRIQGESPEAYAVLEEALTTENNSWVRATMADEVDQLGALARPLWPALRKAARDAKRDVRYEADLALKRQESIR